MPLMLSNFSTKTLYIIITKQRNQAGAGLGPFSLLVCTVLDGTIQSSATVMPGLMKYAHWCNMDIGVTNWTQGTLYRREPMLHARNLSRILAWGDNKSYYNYFVKRDIVSNCILNTYPYTHRLVQLPSLMGETSLCRGMWLTQILTTGHSGENR